MVLGSVGTGVELRHMEGDCIGVGEVSDEGFVAVAVGGSQMEVAMGYREGKVGRVHKVGEYRRVDTTTNGKQHLLPSREEVLLLDVCYELL